MCFTNIWYEGTMCWRIWELKAKKKKKKKEYLLTANALGGIKWTGACLWTKQDEASTLTFSPNQHLMNFTPSIGQCRHFGWPLPHPTHYQTSPPPCLNILHLFNYLAATLWLGPELQWKLYLPIRAGLVTGAGQISPSGRPREKEMPLATLRRRKCHYLIAGLSFPAFGLPGTARICVHNSLIRQTCGETLSVLLIKQNLKSFLLSSQIPKTS